MKLRHRIARWLAPELHAPRSKKRDSVLEPGVGRVTPVQSFAPGSKGQPVARPTGRYTDSSVADLKTQQTPAELLYTLSRWDPDFSNAVWNFMRVAESGWKAIGCDKEGNPDSKVQERLELMLQRLNWAQDYTQFTMPLSVDGVVAQLTKYVVLRGALACELVLGEDSLVRELVAVDPVRVQFMQPENGVFKPFMKSNDGKDVSLDFPTFVWEVLDPDAETPYEQPPLLSAINAVMFRIGVLEDLQRVVKRVAYPRITVKLLEETIIANMPLDVQVDPEAKAKWLKDRKTEVARLLEDVRPEDALVMWDSMEVGILSDENNPTIDFRPLIEVLSQLITSSLKTLPTIMGYKFSSSQTIAATETLLYTKGVRGIQRPVERAVSRMLTLALLLEGTQGVVKFKFMPIELRPETELENQRAMKQARILELHSEGWISDEEAAEELTGESVLPPSLAVKSGDLRRGDSARQEAEEVQEGDSDSGTGSDPRARERSGGRRAPRGQNALTLIRR